MPGPVPGPVWGLAPTTLCRPLQALCSNLAAPPPPPPPQAHSSAAVVNFSESADPEQMQPYLDTLITKLLLLLQHGKKLVQEGALTAMASVADCSQVRL